MRRDYYFTAKERKWFMLIAIFSSLIWFTLYLGIKIDALAFEYRGYKAEAQKAAHYAMIANTWLVRGR